MQHIIITVKNIVMDASTLEPKFFITAWNLTRRSEGEKRMLHKAWFTGLEHSKWLCKIFHRKNIEKEKCLSFTDAKGHWHLCRCKKCHNRWYELR